jgi:hypothetical protein
MFSIVKKSNHYGTPAKEGTGTDIMQYDERWIRTWKYNYAKKKDAKDQIIPLPVLFSIPVGDFININGPVK